MPEVDDLEELLNLLSSDDEGEDEQVAGSSSSTLVSSSAHCGAKPHLACSFSALRVLAENRKLTREQLDKRLESWTVVPMYKLRRMLGTDCVKQCRFAMIAVVASKTIRESSKGHKYLLLKLSDLRTECLTCFVFESAVMSLFAKISEGTVLAVAGARVMEERSDYKPKAKRFGGLSAEVSLSISKPEQVLAVGMCMDFGFCKKLDYNMNRCDAVINVTERQYCLYHSRKLYAKAASRRNEANKTSSKSPFASGRVASARMQSMHKRLNGMGVTMSKPMLHASATDSGLRTRSQTFGCSMLAGGKMTAGRRMLVRAFEAEKQKQELAARKKALSKTLIKRVSTEPQLGRGLDANSCVSMPSTRRSLRSQLSGGQTLRQRPLAIDRLEAARKKKIAAAAKHMAAVRAKEERQKKASRKRSREQMIGSDKENEANKKRRKLSAVMQMTAKKAGDVLKRKSVNERLAKDEEMRKLRQDIDALANSEAEFDAKRQVTSVQTRVFVCTKAGCPQKGQSRERMNSFCQTHARFVKQRKGCKHFWHCKKCKHKQSTLSKKALKLRCFKCGNEKFERASAYNLQQPKVQTDALRVTNCRTELKALSYSGSKQ